MRNKLLFIVLLGVIFSMTAGLVCVTAQDEKSEVVIAQISDPTDLDPQTAGGTTGGNFVWNIFDGLTIISSDMSEVYPSLATEWEMVDDVTWQFKLREDVVFQNGEKFNAEAIKYTVDRFTRPGTPQEAYKFKSLKAAEVVDEYTVNIITNAPDPLLPFRAMEIVALPPVYTEEAGDNFGTLPIGTGAYKVVENTPNQRIVLEANENYWGGKPDVDRLVFIPVPEVSTRLAELITGNADIILNLSPEDFATIEGNAGLRVETTAGKRVIFVGIDLLPDGPEYLKDVRVRQALNYAIDKEAIIEYLLNGYADQLATLYRTDFAGYDPSIEPYPYDPEKALALLAEAGIDPSDITLKIAASEEVVIKGGEIGEAIASMLQDIGINATADVLANQQIRDMLIGGQEAHVNDELWVWNWGVREPDADSILSGVMHNSGLTSYVRDDKLSEMIDLARAEMDSEKRAEIHKEIQAYLYEECPAIFLFLAHDIYGVNNRVNWTPRRDQYIIGKEISLNK